MTPPIFDDEKELTMVKTVDRALLTKNDLKTPLGRKRLEEHI